VTAVKTSVDRHATRGAACRYTAQWADRQDRELDAPRAEETASGDEQRIDFLARQALKGLVDAAASGDLEHENLLPDSCCLNVA
jgi:cell division protein FtsL